MKPIYIFIVFLVFYTNSFAQKPCPGTPTVDYSGKTYHTVQIGDQCWLKENLDVGKMINVKKSQSNNGKIEKYCYDNDTENCSLYGGLYQWAEVVQYQNGATNTSSPIPEFTGNIQGICPRGWHLPTYAEFSKLLAKIGRSEKSLKDIGQGNGIGAGTNTSGFSALLGGGSYKDTFLKCDFGAMTFFWSSTECGSSDAWGLHLYFDSNKPRITGYSKGTTAESVRCIMDDLPDKVKNKNSFGTPCPGTPTVEYAGKTYHTVQIGSQCWLKENLNKGTMVKGFNAQNVDEKYCYDDDPSNCNKYGGLYQWRMAMQNRDNGANGICPNGWHVPTKSEFKILAAEVEGNSDAILKDYEINMGADSRGFSALMAGYCNDRGYFSGLGNITGIWTSTQTDTPTALALFLDTEHNFAFDNNYKNQGYSVRCIKD